MKKVIIGLLIGFVVGMFLYPVLFSDRQDVNVVVPSQIIPLEPETTYIAPETPWKEIKETDIERLFVVDLIINDELRQIPMIFKATVKGQLINPRVKVLETQFIVSVTKELILKFYIAGEIDRYFNGIYDGQLEAGLAVKKTVHLFVGLRADSQQNFVPLVGIRYIHYF
jgi:hypothetical protein